MAKQRPLVKVDANGITADGDDTRLAAQPHAVAAGYFVNVPVLAQYPDGAIRTGTIAMITEKGMEHFKRTMPLDMRTPGGTA